MDVLHQKLDASLNPPAADEDCLRVPVDGFVQMPYRRSALRTGDSRARALCVLIALAFCAWWLAIRPASPAEVTEVRARVQLQAGSGAARHFDAALAQHADASLLRLHLLRWRSTP